MSGTILAASPALLILMRHARLRLRERGVEERDPRETGEMSFLDT
jgi:hypothetical protein